MLEVRIMLCISSKKRPILSFFQLKESILILQKLYAANEHPKTAIIFPIAFVVYPYNNGVLFQG
jgi:hypothetical protein